MESKLDAREVAAALRKRQKSAACSPSKQAYDFAAGLVEKNLVEADDVLSSWGAAELLGISPDRWRDIAKQRNFSPVRVEKRGKREVPLWSRSDVEMIERERKETPPKRGRKPSK